MYNGELMEFKHRIKRLFNFIPIYEKLQLEMYLFLLNNVTTCTHVETYNNNQNVTQYVHNANLLEKIKTKLDKYFIDLFNKYGF